VYANQGALQQLTACYSRVVEAVAAANTASAAAAAATTDTKKGAHLALAPKLAGLWSLVLQQLQLLG
jgi:hypothetical protein